MHINTHWTWTWGHMESDPCQLCTQNLLKWCIVELMAKCLTRRLVLHLFWFSIYPHIRHANVLKDSALKLSTLYIVGQHFLIYPYIFKATITFYPFSKKWKIGQGVLSLSCSSQFHDSGLQTGLLLFFQWDWAVSCCCSPQISQPFYRLHTE